ncbi:MAG: hypothetical protein LYZ69_02130 [Nitrososphaerales archaeon]|nr:hypothetical protein [Nitrososphaerales archaeon]
MTSARRRSDPIESIHLKISLKTDRATASRVKQAFPSARLKGGICELTIEGKEPSEVAAKAREMTEKLQTVITPPKGFK